MWSTFKGWLRTGVDPLNAWLQSAAVRVRGWVDNFVVFLIWFVFVHLIMVGVPSFFVGLAIYWGNGTLTLWFTLFTVILSLVGLLFGWLAFWKEWLGFLGVAVVVGYIVGAIISVALAAVCLLGRLFGASWALEPQNPLWMALLVGVISIVAAVISSYVGENAK